MKNPIRITNTLQCKECGGEATTEYQLQFIGTGEMKRNQESINIACKCGYYYASESLYDPNKELVERKN